jgi:hypothetical protein
MSNTTSLCLLSRNASQKYQEGPKRSPEVGRLPPTHIGRSHIVA